MKPLSIILFLILLPYITFSQIVDTIIKTNAYTSYYSFKLKNPLMVVYNLHKGGGDCDRSQFRFTTGKLGNRSATAKDYSHSGYDEGHLANAEDFAYDCKLDSITFRFWNCCPQTPQLNRGIWKVNEEDVRGLSQNDSILVLCGSFYSSKIIGDSVYVPETCWKVVYSHTQKKVLMCYIFTNTTTPVMKPIDIKVLNNMLKTKYKIDLAVFLKK